MVPPEENVPEPVLDRPEQATGEISMLPPEEAEKVVADIKAIAESRGEDEATAEVVVDLQTTARTKRTTSLLPPMATLAEATPQLTQQLAQQQATNEVGDDVDAIEDLRAADKPLADIAPRYKLKIVPVTMPADGAALSAEPTPAETAGL